MDCRSARRAWFEGRCRPRALQDRLAHKQASHLWRIRLIMFPISGAVFESDHEAEAMRPQMDWA